MLEQLVLTRWKGSPSFRKISWKSLKIKKFAAISWRLHVDEGDMDFLNDTFILYPKQTKARPPKHYKYWAGKLQLQYWFRIEGRFLSHHLYLIPGITLHLAGGNERFPCLHSDITDCAGIYIHIVPKLHVQTLEYWSLGINKHDLRSNMDRKGFVPPLAAITGIFAP